MDVDAAKMDVVFVLVKELGLGAWRGLLLDIVLLVRQCEGGGTNRHKRDALIHNSISRRTNMLPRPGSLSSMTCMDDG